MIPETVAGSTAILVTLLAIVLIVVFPLAFGWYFRRGGARVRIVPSPIVIDFHPLPTREEAERKRKSSVLVARARAMGMKVEG